MLGRILMALVVMCGVSGCEDLFVRTSGVGSDTSTRTTTSTVSTPAASELADRLIAFFPCASADWSPENPHQMTYHLEDRGGWQRFVDNQVFEAIERFGYKRVFFHLPFGKATEQSPRALHLRKTGKDDASLERWHMSMDTTHDLERTGNMHIANDFYTAMRRLHAKHPEVEVIVYVGSWDDEDERVAKEQGIDEVYRRWHESVDPLIEMDYVSIVFDAAVAKPKDHPNAKFVQWAAEQKRKQPGRFVGVEARIQKANPWPNELCLADVAWEPIWRQQAHAGNIPANQLCGPVIRVIDGHARSLLKGSQTEDPGAWIEMAADIVRDGHDPAVSTLPGRAMKGREIRMPGGRTVTLPETTAQNPYRMPASTLAAILVEEAGGG